MSTANAALHAQHGGGGRSSSSPELSSPPRSSPEPASPAAQQLSHEQRLSSQPPTATAVHNAEVASAPAPAPVPAAPVRKKPGRKPKAVTEAAAAAAAAASAEAPKTKKPRKQREPKDTSTASSTAGQPGRKRKTTSLSAPEAVIPEKQPKLAENNLMHFTPPTDPASAAQNGNFEDIRRDHAAHAGGQRPINSFFFTNVSDQKPMAQAHYSPPLSPYPPKPADAQRPDISMRTQPPPQPPSQTRGQAYDPVRSNYDPVRETTMTSSHNPFSSLQSSPKPLPLVNRASASPSIASLVDPPHSHTASSSPGTVPQTFFQPRPPPLQDAPTSVPTSPTVSRPAPSPSLAAAQIPPQPVAVFPAKQADAPNPAAGFVAASTKKAPSGAGTTTTSSSTAPSPKPAKVKEKDIPAPPPLPGTGSGLLQSAMLGGMGPGPDDGNETRAPTVVLHISLSAEPNKIVNFSRLAEERYGWDALHPRLAAQRDRLARVAAAGAALQANGSKESGDEMSLDLSEGEGSNVEMGGMSDGRAGTDTGVKKPVRKRKMKEDEYDKDDGFIDDSELIWEETAAVSKDGFFVYSGPLVPQEEKPAETRPDGAPRGRGRGRGRGGSTRGAGRGGASGGGPGSRGGHTTRKPRITKADRLRMEQEKLERERMGNLTAKTNGHGGVTGGNASMSQLSTAPMMGGTQLVFSSAQ